MAYARWWFAAADGWHTNDDVIVIPPPPPPPGQAALNIRQIFAVAQGTTGGDVRPPAGTPGTVRIEDLTGATLQAKLLAASAAAGSSNVIVTFPPGVFSFSDFGYSFGGISWGLFVPWNVGIWGSGDGTGRSSVAANCTTFQMVPDSSTKGGTIPAQATNNTIQHTVMGTQNTGTTNPVGTVFKHFALLGTHQPFVARTTGETDPLNRGHMYNGMRFGHTVNLVMEHVYIEGTPGNAGAPPGETFAVNIYQGSGAKLLDVEVDGRRTRQGGTVSIAASPIGHNTHQNSVLTDCIVHDSTYGMPTWWESNGCLTRNLQSYNNKAGMNHENVNNITHIDSYTAPIGNYHFTMRNDPLPGTAAAGIHTDAYGGNGILRIQNPRWKAGPAGGGKLVVGMEPRSSAATYQDAQTSPPIVTDANGVAIGADRVFVVGN